MFQKYYYIYQESFICKFCFVLKLYVQNSVNIQVHRNRISHHHYFQSLEVMNISKVLQHNFGNFTNQLVLSENSAHFAFTVVTVLFATVIYFTI